MPLKLYLKSYLYINIQTKYDNIDDNWYQTSHADSIGQRTHIFHREFTHIGSNINWIVCIIVNVMGQIIVFIMYDIVCNVYITCLWL